MRPVTCTSVSISLSPAVSRALLAILSRTGYHNPLLVSHIPAQLILRASSSFHFFQTYLFILAARLPGSRCFPCHVASCLFGLKVMGSKNVCVRVCVSNLKS